jgi:hypothetical protein
MVSEIASRIARMSEEDWKHKLEVFRGLPAAALAGGWLLAGVA